MDASFQYRIPDHSMYDRPSYSDIFGDDDDYNLDDDILYFDPAACAARSQAARALLTSGAAGSCSLAGLDAGVPASPQTVTAPSPDLSYTSTPMSTRSVNSDCDSDGDVQYSFADADADSGFDFSLGPYIAYPPGAAHPDSPAAMTPKSADPYNAFTDGLEEPPPTPSIPDMAFGLGTQDDTAVKRSPSGRVDYLAHEWKQEELWASYKYVATRRDELPDGHRLENASWRSWAKKMNGLATVTAESLNWLKDCDTTWLYGPIIVDTPATSLPTYTCAINKRPILKKRSVSEIMLAKSLSTASLLKDATAAVQAQSSSRSGLQRAPAVDYVSLPSFTNATSGQESLATSSTSSGIMSPSSERRRIQFNESVTQCIAVDYQEHDAEDHVRHYDYNDYHDGYSSDDAMTMKRPLATRGTPYRQSPTKRRKSSIGTRIIAMLPSTTLKAEVEPPSPTPPTSSILDSGPQLFRTSSQETLRPAKPTTSFLFGDSDDDDMGASDDWQMPDFSGGYGMQNAAVTSSPAFNEEPAGMRRTSSGMFMPIDEDERPPTEGLIGRVLEAVNTAKDIGHVIWNVGWSGR